MRIIKHSLVLSSLVFSHAVLAQSWQGFPLNPRVNGYVNYSNKNSNGQIDAMLPFLGNQDGHIYADVDATYASDKSWLGALGIGARQVLPGDQFLLGGYGFVERIQTTDASDVRNRWTYVNPGIEAMTNHWDGRVNGYIPVGPRERYTSPTVLFGDQLPAGTTAFQEHFSQHTLYDQLFNVVTTRDIPWGMDADVGYTFTQYKYARVHGGGYYFRYPVSEAESIRGIEGGVEIPVNNYVTLQFNDTYDKVTKNTGMIGLRLTLGGINKNSTQPVVRERLLDPLYRHLSSIPVNTTVQAEVLNNGQQVVEQEHLWFFKETGGSIFNPSSGLANCTYENPCNGNQFTQSNAQAINGIDSGTNFYFSPGAYSLGGTLTLPQGQSMFGRSADYFMPASAETGFPTFEGLLNLSNGNNTLDSIGLSNNNAVSNATAISISSGNNVVINNVQIANSFKLGVSLDNAKNILIQNSTINTFNNGITVANNSTANIQNNIINVSGNSAVDLLSGIDVLDGSQVTFNNNTVNVNANSAPQGSIMGTGVYVSGSGATLAGSHNTFTITGNDELAGIWNLGGNVNFSSSIFNINNTNATTGYVTGIESDDSGAITTVNNSTFNLSVVSTGTGHLYGVNNQQGTVNISNNAFNFTPLTIPVSCIAGSGTTNSTSNTFNVTC